MTDSRTSDEAIIRWTCKCGKRLTAYVKPIGWVSCGYEGVACPNCGIETELPSRLLHIELFPSVAR